MLNPKFVQMTEEMGARYAQAKLNISWAEGVNRVTTHGNSLPSILPLRQVMARLHRAWGYPTPYADANFPALLDEFEAIWSQIMSEYQSAK